MFVICLRFYFLYDCICYEKSNKLFLILNNNTISIGFGVIFCYTKLINVRTFLDACLLDGSQSHLNILFL